MRVTSFVTMTNKLEDNALKTRLENVKEIEYFMKHTCVVIRLVVMEHTLVVIRLVVMEHTRVVIRLVVKILVTTTTFVLT